MTCFLKHAFNKLQNLQIHKHMGQLIFFNGKNFKLHLGSSNGNASTLTITNDSEFTGKSFICNCELNGKPVIGKWSIVDGTQHASMNESGKVTVNSGVQSKSITVQC